MPEEILEEGTVIETHDGLALVSIIPGGACEECGARILCKSSGEESSRVTALDPFGVQPGDRVRIAARGKNVLLASLYLYGIPLFLLLTGIVLGAKFFSRDRELYSCLLGIGLCAFYYVILRFASVSGLQSRRIMPRIDKVLMKQPGNSPECSAAK